MPPLLDPPELELPPLDPPELELPEPLDEDPLELEEPAPWVLPHAKRSPEARRGTARAASRIVMGKGSGEHAGCQGQGGGNP
jgi:hypothetical protein